MIFVSDFIVRGLVSLDFPLPVRLFSVLQVFLGFERFFLKKIVVV